MEMAAPATSYCRLRGLPFTITPEELAQWFASAPGGPLQVARVVFTYNTTGRKSGEAVRTLLAWRRTACSSARGARSDRRARRTQFVELPDMGADRAVQVLNHRNIGSRYIEVFLSSAEEMAQASVTPPVVQQPTGSGQPWPMDGQGANVRTACGPR